MVFELHLLGFITGKGKIVIGSSPNVEFSVQSEKNKYRFLFIPVNVIYIRLSFFKEHHSNDKEILNNNYNLTKIYKYLYKNL